MVAHLVQCILHTQEPRVRLWVICPISFSSPSPCFPSVYTDCQVKAKKTKNNLVCFFVFFYCYCCFVTFQCAGPNLKGTLLPSKALFHVCAAYCYAPCCGMLIKKD